MFYLVYFFVDVVDSCLGLFGGVVEGLDSIDVLCVGGDIPSDADHHADGIMVGAGSEMLFHKCSPIRIMVLILLEWTRNHFYDRFPCGGI